MPPKNASLPRGGPSRSHRRSGAGGAILVPRGDAEKGSESRPDNIAGIESDRRGRRERTIRFLKPFDCTILLRIRANPRSVPRRRIADRRGTDRTRSKSVGAEAAIEYLSGDDFGPPHEGE
jgi:hypothetical protein